MPTRSVGQFANTRSSASVGDTSAKTAFQPPLSVSYCSESTVADAMPAAASVAAAMTDFMSVRPFIFLRPAVIHGHGRA